MKEKEAEILYGELINREYYGPEKHPPMTAAARAAQFAPFSALTGYDSGIRESARYVEQKAELDEQEIARIDGELQILRDMRKKRPLVSITFFERDEKKPGGSYRTVIGNVLQIEPALQLLQFVDGTEIPLSDIYRIERVEV